MYIICNYQIPSSPQNTQWILAPNPNNKTTNKTINNFEEKEDLTLWPSLSCDFPILIRCITQNLSVILYYNNP